MKKNLYLYSYFLMKKNQKDLDNFSENSLWKSNFCTLRQSGKAKQSILGCLYSRRMANFTRAFQKLDCRRCPFRERFVYGGRALAQPSFVFQSTLFKPWGKIEPTTLLLALTHLNLKTCNMLYLHQNFCPLFPLAPLNYSLWRLATLKDRFCI